jgi:hypothetical protein
MKKTLIIAAAFGLLACAVISFAQDAAPGAKTRVKKEVSSSAVQEIEGKISAINNNGIAVVFNKNESKGAEEEIYVPFDKTKITLVHKRVLNEIEVGDTVKVVFKEVTDEVEGKESKRLQATTITFLGKAEKRPATLTSEEIKEAGSQEQQFGDSQNIPLKGMKED